MRSSLERRQPFNSFQVVAVRVTTPCGACPSNVLGFTTCAAGACPGAAATALQGIHEALLRTRSSQPMKLLPRRARERSDRRVKPLLGAVVHAVRFWRHSLVPTKATVDRKRGRSLQQAVPSL